MKSCAMRRFRELFAAVPIRVQAQAPEAYRFFQLNPNHPGLHFKSVHDDPPTYSARVGIGYRALGVGGGTRERACYSLKFEPQSIMSTFCFLTPDPSPLDPSF